MRLAVNITLIVLLVIGAIVLTIDYIRNRKGESISGIELIRLRNNYYTTTMILLCLLLLIILERII